MLTLTIDPVELDGVYQPNPYLNAHETGLVVLFAAIAKAETVIEFGCNKGLTARVLLKKLPTIKRYIGIDVPPNHKTVLAQQHSEIPAKAGLYAIEDSRFELLVRPQGTLSFRPENLPECDLVWIDGDHSHKVVTHDSHLARAIVRPGGYVLWHDYSNSQVEVTRALDDLTSQGWPICHITGTWVAVLKV